MSSFLLLGVGTDAAVAAGSSSNAFDPANSSSSITFSGSNLVATQGAAGSFALARAVDNASTGKFYWRMTATTASGSMSPGCLCNDTFAKDFSSLGSDNNGIGLSIGGGNLNFLLNNVALGTIAATAALANGDVLDYVADLTNKLIWGRYNAGSWNNGTGDPVAGTGGYSFGTIAAGVTGKFYAAAQTFQNTAVTANFNPGGTPSGSSLWP